jgi:hypothetical protein
MTAAREAIVLPVILLTVTLVGAMRIAERVAFIAPSVFSLVLAFLLLGVLVRSGTMAPGRLMNAARTPLANLNGFIVLMTTVAASGGIFSMMTPERGLPRVAFAVFFLVLLLNTLAAAPDRPRLLRSLTVIFGSGTVGAGGGDAGARAARAPRRGDARHADAERHPSGVGVFGAARGRPVPDRPRASAAGGAVVARAAAARVTR